MGSDGMTYISRSMVTVIISRIGEDLMSVLLVVGGIYETCG
jgi:hypothetical protein